MPRIISRYRQQSIPFEVKLWEQRAEEAPTDMSALIQLTYHLMLQVRILKQLLIWMLIIIPGGAVLILLLLGGLGVFSDPSSY